MDGAPLLVTALFGDADFAWVDGLRRAHFPPERNHVPAHLTLFHHLPPSLEAELDRRLREETAGVPSPPAAIFGPISLGTGVALRVRSEPLVRMRERLADAFTGMLIPQDQADWRPHITIQNKVKPDVARILLASLVADPTLCRPLRVTGLASWRYRGGPWESLRRYRFR